MSLFETLLQDLRYGARTLRRDLSFTRRVDSGVGARNRRQHGRLHGLQGVRRAAARCARPRTRWSISRYISSPARPRARFSYPDYEAYRDRSPDRSAASSRSPSNELTLTDAGGAAPGAARENGVADRKTRAGASVREQRRDRQSTFVVSENYFSVLGVSSGPWARVRRLQHVRTRHVAFSVDQ